MHPLLADLLALLAAYLVGFVVRRYFIITSGEAKTNLPFIKKFDLLLGSKDIIFTNDKVLAVNAQDRHEELGDTFGCFFGQNMQLVTRDPDLIYKICVTDFQRHRNRYQINSLSNMRDSVLEARDNQWQTTRRVLGSVLKSSKLKIDNVDTDLDVAASQMLTSIEARVKQAQANEQEPILDVYQINKNFFMQAILKIIYNTDKLVDFDSDHNDVVEEMHKFIAVNYEYVARLCFLLPALAHLVRPMLSFFDHGRYFNMLTAKLEGIIAKIISSTRDRKSAPANQQQQQQQVNGQRLTTIHSLINSHRKGELNRDQLMGNAFFLMLAGFATSVDSMTALLWELARNPEVQDKLRADLLQYGEDSKYLEQCINETLRLYPGSISSRELGEHAYYKDFRLVKGSYIFINIYSVHRDPRYWGADAHLWKPDRFEPSKTQHFHPAQFIPFGIGPRNCVGYNLARLELTKFTAQFLLKYKVHFCPATEQKLQFVALGALPVALPIKQPVYLKLTPTSC